MSIWRWPRGIEAVDQQSQLSLGEGETPLIRSKAIGPQAGLDQLWLKLDHCNPTASFKDRYAAVAISHMRSAGQTRCVATSSGNTGASLAAYCAAANISCHIALVETAPLGKLQQMLAYGANIMRIRGFGLDIDVTASVFDRLVDIATAPDTALQISAFRYSPLGMSGIRSVSFELNEQVSGTIDHVFCQAGGGGLAMGTAEGFLQLAEEGAIARAPRVHAVQPTGNDTIATPLRDGSATGRDVNCTTKISGLQVASVTDADGAILACRDTDGTGYLVDDDFVWSIQQQLARDEGIFCEPAAAVSVAGALRSLEMGEVSPDSVIVCMITGSGFKDPASVETMIGQASCPLIEPDQVTALMS
ncbi:MAG TPA: pyridoxal-phosphate dependent enzyme [Planctomycetaceae bacterium]|nr:pyridoxal-phosphate dependent enzyme [Planctomycetaceae bacterium]